MKRRSKLQRLDKEFDLELDKISRMRFESVDREFSKPISRARLTRRIRKYPEWDQIKSKLLKEPRIEDL